MCVCVCVCVESIPRLIYVGSREWDFVVASSGTDESMHFPVKSPKTFQKRKIIVLVNIPCNNKIYLLLLKAFFIFNIHLYLINKSNV